MIWSVLFRSRGAACDSIVTFPGITSAYKFSYFAYILFIAYPEIMK